MELSLIHIFIMRNFLMTIPIELEEAAEIDGAGQLGIMLKVYLPLAKSVMRCV